MVMVMGMVMDMGMYIMCICIIIYTCCILHGKVYDFENHVIISIVGRCSYCLYNGSIELILQCLNLKCIHGWWWCMII